MAQDWAVKMRGMVDFIRGLRARLIGGEIPYLLPSLLFLAAVIAGIYFVDLDRREQFRVSERQEALKELADLTGRLEAGVNNNVNLVQGLVSVLSVNPPESQADFEPLAASVFERSAELRSLAAAPDMVIRMIYPEKPNRKAIGLDYRASAEQRPGVLRARDSRRLVLSGPINLVQGGTGIIARYPVYLNRDGRFWGIVSAVVDLPRLYHGIGLNLPGSPLTVALYRENGDGERSVFFGDASVLEREPVTHVIQMGINVWHVAAIPTGGWGGYQVELARFRAMTALIAVLILIPLIWAAQLTKQRQANIQALKDREERLETLSQRLELALKASDIGVWEFIPGTNTLIWDQRMRELYGVPADKRICDYGDWRSRLHPDDLEEAEAVFKRCLEREIPYITDFRIHDSNGEVRHIRAHGGIHHHSGGLRIVGANWDITRDIKLQSELRDARDQLEHQSLHDALTGLANRRYLERFLNGTDFSGGNDKLGLIHADLDHFKEVNDTFGHNAGDCVLRTAADRILALVQPHEFASRIGGDEFVIVTMGAEAEERAARLAEQIVAALAEPIRFEDSLCRIGCSAGVAVQTFRHENPLQLLGNADMALYEAKKRGRNRVELFSDGLRAAAVEAKRTTDELMVALERDEFEPYFQPQFSAETLEIIGAEALARWNHPTRGILTPDKFLGIAESANKVAELDALIFEKSLFHLARWQANALDIPSVSVNISAQRLGDERLFETLERLAVTPGTVSFELLETIYLDGADHALVLAAQRLKSLGIDIEIDDFGSGHASIISLLELAPKRLKIDRKLVAPIRESLSQRQLVASIIEIGRSQGIEILAEGVETMDHAHILRDLGCHALQGYAFAKPMQASAMMDFARDWQARKERLLAVG
jgi:diguanylate cyclase (GGDEF)-like protein/PAS domain S-box-containing protein